MKKNLIFATSLMLLFSAWAQAASDTDVIQAWVNSRYQDCDSSFSDHINTSHMDHLALKSLGNNECAGAPNSPSGACLKAADHFLSVYAMQANSYGCNSNPKWEALLESTEASKKVEAETYTVTVSCSPRGGYVFDRQSSSKICSKKFDCRNNFVYLGQKFTPGEYRFTCTMNPDGTCDNGIEDGCMNPTIQKIGWIYNDAVIKLNSSAGGAR